MISEHQLRTIIFYEWRQGHNVSVATANISKAFGEGVVSRWKISRWFARFASGDITLEDHERSGRPSTFDDEELLRCLKANPEINTRDLAETLGCHHSTVEAHLHKLGYRKVMARWIPHQLTDSHRQVRVSICESLLFQPHRKEFLEDLVTGDESWILYDNNTRHAVWLPYDAEPPTQPKPNRHSRKHLLSVWWDAKGPLYYELLPARRTITTSIYTEQLQKLADAIREKRPRRVNVHLLHDNARPHVASETRQKIVELGWHPVAHPPYSPDLAPSDYHLFRPLKLYLREKNFQNYEDLKMAVDNFFSAQPPEFWAQGINNLPTRWARVIELFGDYITD